MGPGLKLLGLLPLKPDNLFSKLVKAQSQAKARTKSKNGRTVVFKMTWRSSITKTSLGSKRLDPALAQLLSRQFMTKVATTHREIVTKVFCRFQVHHPEVAVSHHPRGSGDVPLTLSGLPRRLEVTSSAENWLLYLSTPLPLAISWLCESTWCAVSQKTAHN